MSEEKETVVQYKTIKVTNPLYVGQVANVIGDYVKRLNVDTITYESLYTYFCHTVQLGGSQAEFWVVVDQDNNPVAFGNWFVRSMPHIGAAHFDNIYSWNRMKEPASLLIDEFLNFAVRNRCPWIDGTCINATVFRVFQKAAAKRGIDLKDTEQINFIGRK
jgi:hypothetical protein